MTETEKAIALELKSLESEAGRLTADLVVDAAKSPTSPLHAVFEWDDSKAAHEHRLEQARALIRSVKVEIVTDVRTVSTVRYVRDPEAGAGQGYVSVPQLQCEPANASKLVDQEFARALACLARAESLAEVLGEAGAVREASGVLSQFRKRFSPAPSAQA